MYTKRLLRNIIYTLCIMFFCAPFSHAQQKTLRNGIRLGGIKFYSLHEYAYAERNFTKWIKKNSSVTDTLILKLLADCEWKLRKYGDAYLNYWRLYRIKDFYFTPEMKQRMADLNAMNDNYHEAVQVIDKNKEWERKQQGFRLIDRYLFDSLDWRISYPLFNTTANEYLPYYYPWKDLLFVNTDYRLKSDSKYNVNPMTGGEFSDIKYYHTILNLPLSDVKYNYKRGNLNDFYLSLNGTVRIKKIAAMHEASDVPLLSGQVLFINPSPVIRFQLMPLKFNPQNYYNKGCISMEAKADTALKVPVYFVANIIANKHSIKKHIKKDSTLIPLGVYKGNLYNIKRNLVIKDIQLMRIKGFHGELLHATVSRDGMVMVFSGRDSGRNDYDLYYAIRDSDVTWNRVHTLNENINTCGNEVFPQLQNDGTLYFSSDGLAGMGGLDIFKVKDFYVSGKLYYENKPEHLGYPVNSAFDDYGLTIVKREKEKILNKKIDIENGFFTSNRGGSDDILHFRFREAYIVACGFIGGITGNEHYTPVGGARVIIKTKTLDDKTITDSTLTDKYGNYCFAVKPNRKYNLEVSQQGWKISEDNGFMVPAVEDSMAAHYTIDPLLLVAEEKKKPSVVSNIDTGQTFIVHHYYDKTTIITSELAVFDSAVNYIKLHQGCRVEIVSAADCFGSARYAIKLSKRRADAVTALLRERGITVTDSKAVGQTEKVVDCDSARTPLAQTPNRYTKIKVMVK